MCGEKCRNDCNEWCNAQRVVVCPCPWKAQFCHQCECALGGVTRCDVSLKAITPLPEEDRANTRGGIKLPTAFLVHVVSLQQLKTKQDNESVKFM